MNSLPSSPSFNGKLVALLRAQRAFCRSVGARIVGRAFTPPPPIPIWKWADEGWKGKRGVWLQNEDAAEPGPYRSAKTPWTRRLQDLPRRPWMWVWDYAAEKWIKTRVTEVDIQKSTQSGFTEAVLNVIRWFASFLQRNVIYLIDSAEQGKKIARRLLRSLKLLDPRIFSGDPDDLKTLEFLLRGMEVIFGGSFSPGTTANKQAPVVVADEIEDHGQQVGDTSSTRNLSYRKKTASGGIQFNLSKPKLENGPINKLWKRGNREEFHIECPHCRHLQFFTYRPEEYDSPFSAQWVWVNEETGENFAELPSEVQLSQFIRLPRPLPLGETRKVTTGRLVYEHCRDLLGNLDEVRVLRETWFECARCKGAIEEHEKQRLTLEAASRDSLCGWLPTAIGMPGIISQRMSDLPSTEENSSWGQIVLELHSARKESRVELQGVVNNRLGNAWAEELNKTEEGDIRANVAGKELFFIDIQTDRGFRRDVFETEHAAEIARAVYKTGTAEEAQIVRSFCQPYKRGTIPFVPTSIILGSDVGGAYARWVIIAVMENQVDAAVIDWGDEIDPEAIGEIVLTQTWPCHADGKRHRIAHGFIDAKYRRIEVNRVCWQTMKAGGRLIPVTGLGGTASRSVRVWSYTPVETYARKGKGLHKLGYNDRESKNDLYIACLSKKTRRIFFPTDLFDREGRATDPRFVDELCQEELIEDRHGQKNWNEHVTGNHWGDGLKNAVTGLRYLTRKHHRAAPTANALTSTAP